MVEQADEFEGGLVPSIPAVNAAVDGVEISEEAAAQLEGANTDVLKAIVNQALAARDAEVSALRSELQAVRAANGAGASGGLLTEQASVGGYPWMYWRKPMTWPDESSRGWISVGPGGPTPSGNRDAGSFNLYLKKGLIPVTRYGYVQPPTRPEAIDSFLPILRAGGAKEFPASQVIAYQWHIRPPIPGLVFPTYEAARAGIITTVCEACGHTLFFLAEESAKASENLRAHLMTTHKYPFREAVEALRQAGLSTTAVKATAGDSV